MISDFGLSKLSNEPEETPVMVTACGTPGYVGMCVYMHAACVSVCVYTYMHASLSACLSMCTHVCVFVCVHSLCNACVCMYVCKRASVYI